MKENAKETGRHCGMGETWVLVSDLPRSELHDRQQRAGPLLTLFPAWISLTTSLKVSASADRPPKIRNSPAPQADFLLGSDSSVAPATLGIKLEFLSRPCQVLQGLNLAYLSRPSSSAPPPSNPLTEQSSCFCSRSQNSISPTTDPTLTSRDWAVA